MSWKLVAEAVQGRFPPWLDRFLSQVGRGAHRHGMIRSGDRILVGVSGGKDSIATALALALRRRRVWGDYDVAAAMIDWAEFPARSQDLDLLHAFFDLLALPFSVHRVSLTEWTDSRGFSCYTCARARKRVLFETAKAEGFGTVAFGHHLDDFVSTVLMNLCFRARLEPLEPVREFFGGELRVIRPLCELRESAVSSLSRRLELPVLSIECPNAEGNLRKRLVPVVAELAKMDKLVRENIYNSWYGRERGEEGRWKSGT
ncbi:MAG: ATP-binding protein [Spirochaetaceae bacterium]|nr:ATP-binding protein [Spirochaetaceae bacterium]